MLVINFIATGLSNKLEMAPPRRTMPVLAAGIGGGGALATSHSFPATSSSSRFPIKLFFLAGLVLLVLVVTIPATFYSSNSLDPSRSSSTTALQVSLPIPFFSSVYPT